MRFIKHTPSRSGIMRFTRSTPHVDAITSAEVDHDGVNWTAHLPECCRLLVVQHLDSDARAAWRSVCRIARQDVDACTRKLSWRGDPNTVGKRHTASPANLPAALFVRLPNLQNMWCKGMSSLKSIRNIPATLQCLLITNCGSLTSLAPLQQCTALESFALDVSPICFARLADTLPQAMSAIAPHLRRLSLVTELGAAGHDDSLFGAIMRSLQPLSHLRELSLSLQLDQQRQWQALAQCVRQMTDLQALHLPNNFAGSALSAFAPAVGQLKQLKELDLSMNYVDSSATAALAQALVSLPPSLTRLALSEALDEPVNATALADMLRAHSVTLSDLELAQIPLGHCGMAVLVRGLQHCSALSYLDLGSCELGDRSAPALATALSGCAPSLTCLRLSFNGLGQGSASALAPPLSRMTTLENMDLCHNSLCPAAAAALCPPLALIASSLSGLDLSWNPLGDKGAAALAPALKRMTALTFLELSHTSVGPAGAAALACALSAMTSLQELVLEHNSVQLAGLRSIAQGLQVQRRQQCWSIYVHPDFLVDGALTSDEEFSGVARMVGSMPYLQAWELLCADDPLEGEERSARVAASAIRGLRVTFHQRAVQLAAA